MEHKKLCLIFNAAPHYRKEIFDLIDKTYNAYFVIGSGIKDIKSLDMSNFRNKVVYTTDVKFKGRGIWQKKILSYVFKDFETYLIGDDIYKVNHWIFLILCKIKHKKVYSWTHGWYGKETKIKTIIKKVYFRLFTGVFLYGNRARQLMIKEGFNPKKLWVVHNSLNYSLQISIREENLRSNIYISHFNNCNPNLIFIGRLTKVKKLEMLLDAINLLKNSGCNCNLTFIGNGTERDFLEEKVHNLELSNNVWFYGACYDEYKNAELIYNADLCVAPGNVGLTAMHTMVFGTPILTHNDFKWQMPEFEAIVLNETGAFFEKDNVNDFVMLLI